MARTRRYYFGSYGMIRGYGPLYRSLQEADASVFTDAAEQRKKHGGSTDRNAVCVDRENGLCWWLNESDEQSDRRVLTASGVQASYTLEAIRKQESLWGTVVEQCGLG